MQRLSKKPDADQDYLSFPFLIGWPVADTKEKPQRLMPGLESF